MNNANEREIKRLLREVIDDRIAANEESDKEPETSLEDEDDEMVVALLRELLNELQRENQ